MLLRCTATNRAADIFWSVSEFPKKVLRPSAQAPVPRERPAPPPPQGARPAGRPAWAAPFVAFWTWLRSLMSWWRAGARESEPHQARSTAVARQAETTPPFARRPSIVSHPIVIEDGDLSADAYVPNWVARVVPSGVEVPPRALGEAPCGLRVGFTLTRDIAAPMIDVARTICDSKRGHAWIDRCVESRLLLATSTGPVAYHRYRLPWVGDRDSVTRATVQAPRADMLTISLQSWDEPLPQAEVAADVVRLPWVQGSFTLTATSPADTRVCHSSQLVLGGGIPRFLGPMLGRRQQRSLEITLSRLAGLLTDAG